jgi:hypothetical protein
MDLTEQSGIQIMPESVSIKLKVICDAIMVSTTFTISGKCTTLGINLRNILFKSHNSFLESIQNSLYYILTANDD